VRDTWRDTQLHGEEKREEGDRGDQEEKKSSSTHQNTNTSFPNQETLTIQPHPQQANSTIKRTPQTARILKGHQTQQYKQDEKAEKHPAGKGTG